jgi:hypothetical protein
VTKFYGVFGKLDNAPNLNSEMRPLAVYCNSKEEGIAASTSARYPGS